MSQKDQYERYTKIGDIELKQGNTFVAEQNFKLALEEAQKPESNCSLGYPLLMLAKTNYINCKYVDAEKLFMQSIDAFENEVSEASKNGIFEANIGLIYLYLDWEKYDGASKIHEAINVINAISKTDLDTEQIGHLAIVEGEVYIHQKEFTKAENVLNAALKSIDDKSSLYLHIEKALAFTYYKNNDSEKAIEEYKKALERITKPDLKHEKILIYHDLMFMEFEQGKATSYPGMWQQSIREIDNEYTRIERFHSIALSYLNKKDYSQAYVYLLREHRLYRETGSLFDYGFLSDLASFYSESQEYEKALKCYIRLGDTAKIEQISTSIMEKISPDGIDDFFGNLLGVLEANPSVQEKTGIASALGSLYEISPKKNDLLVNILESLIKLCRDEYSFIGNMDVKRAALKALENYINIKIPLDQVIEDIIDCLIDASNHEVPFVREHAANCFNAFYKIPDMIPNELRDRVRKHLSEWVNREKNDRVKELLDSVIANLAFYFGNPWKEEFIKTLKELDSNKKPISRDRLILLAWLGEKIPEEKVDFVFKPILTELLHQEKYSKTDRKSLFDGIYHLGYMMDQIPEKSKSEIVEKAISALNNKYNLIHNKRIILQTLGGISSNFGCHLQNQLWDIISSIASEWLDKIDSGEKDDESNFEFMFGSPEELVRDSIYAVAKLYSIISDKGEKIEQIKQLLLQTASSKEAKIRQMSAYCFQFLDKFDLESQLTLFSLLFDEDIVSSRAIHSIAELSDKTWDNIVLRKVIEKLLLHVDRGNLEVKLVTAYALNKLVKKAQLIDDDKVKVEQAREKLKHDKFYRVRRQALSSV